MGGVCLGKWPLCRKRVVSRPELRESISDTCSSGSHVLMTGHATCCCCVVSWLLLLHASCCPHLASSTGAPCSLRYQMLCFMAPHHCGPPLGCLLQLCGCPGCRQHLLAPFLTICVP